jgi:hypothetical protein
MATYNVTVYNSSPAEKQFALFCELPQVNPAPAEGKPFANAFAVGRPASNDGQPTTFNVTTKAYACCGYQEISENTIVSSSDNIQVELNGQNDVATMKITDGGPSFTSPNHSGAADGTFNVNVPSYAQEKYPNVWCGYGYPTPSGDIARASRGGPDYTGGIGVAACWTADSNANFIVQPIAKYYVAWGTYTPGQAVNLSEIGTTAEFDFTNQGGKFYAQATLDSENKWGPVTFSSS